MGVDQVEVVAVDLVVVEDLMEVNLLEELEVVVVDLLEV